MISYSVNDVYRPHEENIGSTSSISIGRKVFLTALSIHSMLNPFIFNNLDNNLDFNESVSLDNMSGENISMTFNGKEFIMSAPLMKDTFDQFEKRYESDIKDLKNNQEETNYLLNEINKKIGDRLTEKEVLDLLEKESNKKVVSLLKKLLTYLGTTIIGAVIGVVITKMLS